jgi:DNA-directed RNA polymerase subunit RPC12/RpoP
MSPESEPAERKSVEARRVALSWREVGLVAGLMSLVFGPLFAYWLWREFPGTPLVPAAALAFFWIMAAVEVYQRARGKLARYKCPECGATIGPSKGFSTPAKRKARTECARCAVHLTYPKRG